MKKHPKPQYGFTEDGIQYAKTKDGYRCEFYLSDGVYTTKTFKTFNQVLKIKTGEWFEWEEAVQPEPTPRMSGKTKPVHFITKPE